MIWVMAHDMRNGLYWNDDFFVYHHYVWCTMGFNAGGLNFISCFLSFSKVIKERNSQKIIVFFKKGWRASGWVSISHAVDQTCFIPNLRVIMWYGSRASWFNKQDGSASVKQTELDWIPTTGVDPVALELWAPCASRCATSVTSCSSALMHLCDLMIRYRRQVLILWPRSYEPRALPLSYPG